MFRMRPRIPLQLFPLTRQLEGPGDELAPLHVVGGQGDLGRDGTHAGNLIQFLIWMEFNAKRTKGLQRYTGRMDGRTAASS